VHDVVFVHVADGADEFIENGAGLGFFDVLALDDELEELLAWAQLRHNVDEVVVFEVLVHFHDVRVVLDVGRGTSSRRMENSFMICFSRRALRFFSICFMARRLP
jgi:hypothetical protein